MSEIADLALARVELMTRKTQPVPYIGAFAQRVDLNTEIMSDLLAYVMRLKLRLIALADVREAMLTRFRSLEAKTQHFRRASVACRGAASPHCKLGGRKLRERTSW
jgi:hypothetical protein